MFTMRCHAIQHCINKFGFKRYLEIGLGESGKNFAAVHCEEKVGVEKDVTRTLAQTRTGEDAIFYMASDDFFDQYRKIMRPFDLVFVDGWHSYQQTSNDIFNAFTMLNEGGVVVVHDCIPECDRDYDCVWRSLLDLRVMGDFDFAVGDFNKGVAVIIKSPNTKILKSCEVEYVEFKEREKELLRLVTAEELEKWINTIGG